MDSVKIILEGRVHQDIIEPLVKGKIHEILPDDREPRLFKRLAPDIVLLDDGNLRPRYPERLADAKSDRPRSCTRFGDGYIRSDIAELGEFDQTLDEFRRRAEEPVFGDSDEPFSFELRSHFERIVASLEDVPLFPAAPFCMH